MNSYASYFTTTSLVVTLHALLLLWLYYSIETKTLIPSPQRVVVKTVNLRPPSKTNEAIKPAAAPKEPPVVIKQEKSISPAASPSQPKKDTPSKIAQKKSKPVEKNAPKKSKPEPKIPPKKTSPPPAKKSSLDDAKQALLSQAKENIAKIQAPRVKDNPSFQSGESFKPIAFASSIALKIDGLAEKDMGYEEMLVSHLKLLLKLPEIGNVILDLTLDRMGKVKKIVIIGAASSPNKKYIEKTLSALQLPPFGIYFKGCSERTFRLELRGEI